MNPNYKGKFSLVYHGTGMKGSLAAKLVFKNARDKRKEAVSSDKEYYLSTIKGLRNRQVDNISLNINLDY